MFYRTYIGTPAQQDSSGNYQMPSQQIPCYAMRHFIPVYVSPYPYYGQSRSAVVIAKYYEGAFFNGTISCNNTSLPYVSVAILDNYGFPHDYVFTDENGSFNLLSPGGNITLLFSYANEVLLKQITFNSTNNTLYSPVTDAEAMRLTDSYSRNFTISVDPSTLGGFVYQDNNNNGSYEPTIDSPLSGITIKLNDYYFGRPVQPVKTDQQGYYIFRNLYPSKYNISAVDENEFTLLTMEPINIVPGNNSYNISKPKLAEVKGVVYIDSNSDKKYTSGEEASNMQIQLTYTKLNGTQKSVANTTSGTAGAYSFVSLTPGQYTLNATKQNNTNPEHLVYLTEQTVTLTANKTSWINISLTYAPVLISGYTTNKTIKISSIPVTFTPDKSVKNNTAIQTTSTSDAQGLYVAKLKPGTYNVTVQKTDTGTTVYTFTGKLIVSIGAGTASYNIDVTKTSVTVSGNSTYNGVGKENITILFSKDLQIANNTAITKNVKSDRNGSYKIELTPGSYNVSVLEVINESGHNVTYTGTAGKITLNRGDAPKVLNVLLTREQSP